MTASSTEARLPSTRYSEFSLDFLGEDFAVPLSRTLLRQAGRAWEVSEDSLETLLLLASEVVTNAVKVSPKEPLRLSVRIELGIIRFECSDYHPEIPDTATCMELDAEDGRGIPLVQLLSRACGWTTSATKQGKIRWFTVIA